MGPRGRRQNNIKNDLNDIGYNVWIDLASVMDQ
jgi:hypothetical protein